jgi:D-sedoheptulose 7-phosphate isomerase
MEKFFKNYVNQLTKVLKELDLLELEKIKDELLAARERGNNIFIIGNGGSASTASHVANDFNKGVLGHTGKKKIKRFKTISLTDNISLITAWGNDTSFEDIFSQQLENLINKGDVVILISASGNSANIIKALSAAQKHKAKVVGLAGFDGGKLKEQSDLCLVAKINKYDVAEDAHLIILHMLARWFYENLK